MQARAFGNQLAQLLFPQRHCLLCGAVTGRPGLCAACEGHRQALYQCDVCATFITQPGLCPSCAVKRPRFVLARAAWPYGGVMRNRLRVFKYQEQTWLRRPLSLLLAQTYQQYYAHIPFDAVLPAPLSAKRLKQRGYNQSELLSGLLARELRLKHMPHLLSRLRDTPPLATYNGSQRHALLKGVFTAHKQSEGLTLLLVDDIYTSGATLQACAAVLYAAGVRQVYGLTVAGFDMQEKAGILPAESK